MEKNTKVYPKLNKKV